MPIKHHKRFALITTLVVAPLAHAHPLAAHSVAWQAFIHPFSGADHITAMLVIGLWAGLAAPGRRVVPPLAFVSGLMAGAALGTMGVQLPAVETAIALSVLLLGPLAARESRLPALLCFALCAVAGLFHGYAHGVELSGRGLAGACFVLGSLVLHGLGYGLARRVSTTGHGVALRSALSASGLLALGFLWMA